MYVQVMLLVVIGFVALSYYCVAVLTCGGILTSSARPAEKLGAAAALVAFSLLVRTWCRVPGPAVLPGAPKSPIMSHVEQQDRWSDHLKSLCSFASTQVIAHGLQCIRGPVQLGSF